MLTVDDFATLGFASLVGLPSVHDSCSELFYVGFVSVMLGALFWARLSYVNVAGLGRVRLRESSGS